MPEEGTPGTTETTTTTAAATERVYKQADVDSIAEKVRSTYEKKLAAQAGELEKFKTQAMSEEEKKIAAAKEEAKTEVLKVVSMERRASSIREELLSRGIGKDQLAMVAKLAPDDVEDAAEAVDAIAKGFPQIFASKRFNGGGGRPTDSNSSDEMSDVSPQAIEDKLSSMSWQEQTAWWRKHGPKIIAEQRKNATVQTFAPGEPMI